MSSSGTGAGEAETEMAASATKAMERRLTSIVPNSIWKTLSVIVFFTESLLTYEGFKLF